MNKVRDRAVYCKGGDNGAGAAADANREATALQREMWQTNMQNLAPFTPLAKQYVGQLQNLSSLGGQQQALNEYYNSGQFKDLSNQARYQQLASAEATGGLGSTATSNGLATIAPTLGQNWLSGQMNNYNNLANIGLGALQGQANAGQNFANNAGQLSMQGAGLAAAAGNRPSSLQQGISGGASGALLGGGIASLLGTSTPWGAGIGAGLGLLGSLF
ncbi:TPA: DNA transfer protein [Serratia marcescens]